MSKSVKPAVEANRVYTFSKSGSKVRTIAASTPYLGQPCWTVERTEGASVGKQMKVPASSLE
jgi:hypothetical protein